MRAVDHALELQYHPQAPEVPSKRLARDALRELFTLLPLCKENPGDADIRQKLLIAAYSSLFPIIFSGGLGLSHTIGHAIGATYGIPHGITSCISLAATVHFKADKNPGEAAHISSVLPFIITTDAGRGTTMSGDVVKDAHTVGVIIEKLIADLGLTSSLSDVRNYLLLHRFAYASPDLCNSTDTYLFLLLLVRCENWEGRRGGNRFPYPQG